MSASNTTFFYLTRVCVSPLMHQGFSCVGAGNQVSIGALSVFIIFASQSPPQFNNGTAGTLKIDTAFTK